MFPPPRESAAGRDGQVPAALLHCQLRHVAKQPHLCQGLVLEFEPLRCRRPVALRHVDLVRAEEALDGVQRVALQLGDQRKPEPLG